MVLPSSISRIAIPRTRLLRRVVETCAIIAAFSASFEALLNSTSMIQRNAMAEHRAYSSAACSNDRDDCRSTNPKDERMMYNTTPSGWWPTDQWLERCARAEEEMAKEQGTDNNQFEIQSEWFRYRLGDCIKMCLGCGNFPNTLSALYSERACEVDYQNKMGGNKTIIDEILHLRDGVAGFQKPSDDEMLVHLRLGDAIEDSKNDVATMLVHGGIPKQSAIFKNITGIKSAFELLSNARESGVPKIKIIGGLHKKVNATKSRPYAECLRKTFEKAGYEVSLEVGTSNPDQDFYRLSHAKHIVIGSGGYSRLVGRNAERHGGRIYGRFFEKA